MLITLPSNLPTQLQKFSTIAVPNTAENRQVDQINSGFILLTIDCENKVLRLTTSILSSTGIQGSVDLHINCINPASSDNKQLFVDASKFIGFIKQCELMATQQSNALIVLNIMADEKRMSFSIKQKETTDQANIISDRLNEEKRQKNSIFFPKHSLHYIDVDDNNLALYDFNFSEKITLRNIDVNNFTAAFNNTLTVAKHNYQANGQTILGTHEFYLHVTQKNNLGLYALSSVCLGVEVLPLSQGGVDEEFLVSLGIKTASTLLKLCGDAHQITIARDHNQLLFKIDSALLRVNTISQKKEISAIVSQLNIANHHEDCKIENVKQMLTQFISDDKKHSMIVFESTHKPSTQILPLKVTTRYNCSFNNASTPESEVVLISPSPFKTSQTYSYNLAAFDNAVSAFTSTDISCQWAVDDIGHLLIKQEGIQHKKFYKLIAIKK
jgi:hypothetical protein